MVIKVELFTTNSCPHCPYAINAAQVAKNELGDAIDIEIIKIDESNENRQRAINYQIMAVPTTVIDGEVVFVGAPTEGELLNKIKSMIPETTNIQNLNMANNELIGKNYCSECGAKIEASFKFCTNCGASLSDREPMSNIKHVNKNGLSFDCPDYYDIGSYPSSDEFHKSIVALSKSDRTCELYVMEYKPIHFDNNARRNTTLLKEYLKLQGYTNISENRSLPYCFNARINSGVGMLNTKIVYNFDHPDVIMIVGNTVPESSYNCVNDIKVINDTVRPI